MQGLREGGAATIAEGVGESPVEGAAFDPLGEDGVDERERVD